MINTGVTFSLAQCSTTPYIKIETVTPFLYNHNVNDVLHNPGAIQMGIPFVYVPYVYCKIGGVSECYSRNLLTGNLVVSSSDQSLLSGAVPLFGC